jgi:hypothetical protein
MSKPKSLDDLQRPRRRLGDVVRGMLACPLCCPVYGINPDGRKHLELRVVAYRAHSWRLECPNCGLRFSVDPETLFEAIERPDSSKRPTSFAKAMATVILNRHLYANENGQPQPPTS